MTYRDRILRTLSSGDSLTASEIVKNIMLEDQMLASKKTVMASVSSLLSQMTRSDVIKIDSERQGERRGHSYKIV